MNEFLSNPFEKSQENYDAEDAEVRERVNKRTEILLRAYPNENRDLKPTPAGQSFFSTYGREFKGEGSQEVLELGCGYGDDAITAAKEGYNIKALDISDVSIARAKEKAKEHEAKVDFTQGSMRKLPYENNEFSGVYAIGSLMAHSIGYLRETAREVERVLKPGGIFFFNSVMGINPKSLEDQEKGILRYLSRQIVEQMIEATNFKIEYFYEPDKEGAKNKLTVVALRKGK